jgi:hypothetical protein
MEPTITVWEPRILDWCAGFFDGEGSITLLILNRPGRKGHLTDAVSIRIICTVSQQGSKPPLLFQSLFGGHCGTYSNGVHKAYTKWSITGRPRVAPFLAAMDGRCIVKDAQIKTALEVLALQKPLGFTGGRLPPDGSGRIRNKKFYSGEEMAKFWCLRDRMQKLNANS